MKPIIKWPGGKSRETDRISRLYKESGMGLFIEPFVGGGACFFDVQPEEALLNDINSDLISIFRAAKTNDTATKRALALLVKVWDTEIPNLALEVLPELIEEYHMYRTNWSTPNQMFHLSASTNRIIKEFVTSGFPKHVDGVKIQQTILECIRSKARRLGYLEEREGTRFDAALLIKQFETALRSAMYYFIRDQYVPISSAEKAACFLFIREYCYGSMFRFNKNGKFNIPYGGMAYNHKRLSKKVTSAFSKKRRDLLSRAELFNMDFSEFLERISDALTSKAFVFFDPPYDTEFSAYDNHSFSRDHHIALASTILSLKCRFTMIIKRTDFILSLYARGRDRNQIVIDEYRQKYTYNVRGRNDRNVNHLLIHNLHQVAR